MSVPVTNPAIPDLFSYYPESLPFLNAIVEKPKDYTVRVVFADWIQENDGFCPWCHGRKTERLADAAGDMDDLDCRMCCGTGRNNFLERAEFIRLQCGQAGISPGVQSRDREIFLLTKFGDCWRPPALQSRFVFPEFRGGFVESVQTLRFSEICQREMNKCEKCFEGVVFNPEEDEEIEWACSSCEGEGVVAGDWVFESWVIEAAKSSPVTMWEPLDVVNRSRRGSAVINLARIPDMVLREYDRVHCEDSDKEVMLAIGNVVRRHAGLPVDEDCYEKC